MSWLAIRTLVLDCKAELDEKALLMSLFVFAAIAGLPIYGAAVINLWNTVNTSLGH